MSRSRLADRLVAEGLKKQEARAEAGRLNGNNKPGDLDYVARHFSTFKGVYDEELD